MAQGHFTATSGAMFLAARLAYEQKVHVEVTRDNAPFIDLLVASPDGVQGVGVQVKAAGQAARQNKSEDRPHEYQWDVGKKLVERANPELLVAFVDLKEWTAMPDYYLVPASVIQEHFRSWMAANGREPGRWRYHVTPDRIEHLRNAPNPLLERLGMTDQTEPS